MEPFKRRPYHTGLDHLSKTRPPCDRRRIDRGSRLLSPVASPYFREPVVRARALGISPQSPVLTQPGLSDPGTAGEQPPSPSYRKAVAWPASTVTGWLPARLPHVHKEMWIVSGNKGTDIAAFLRTIDGRKIGQAMNRHRMAILL